MEKPQSNADAKFPIIMKSVAEALKLDSENKNKEAYVQYLMCIQTVAHTLIQDAESCDSTISSSTTKTINIAQQCMERVAKLSQQFVGLDAYPGHHATKDDLLLASEEAPPADQQASTKSSLPAFKPIGMAEPDAGVRRRPRSFTPLEEAQRQNQQLMMAYRTRVAKMSLKNPSVTNMSLTLQRKLAENLAIANAREQALAKKVQERQRRLQEEAARRFTFTTGMSEDEQERRRMYTRVLEYEQDVKWLLSWRKKLISNSEDTRLMQDLVKTIIKTGDHPLTKMIAEYQWAVYNKLSPTVSHFIHELDHIKVPLEKSDFQLQSSNKGYQKDDDDYVRHTEDAKGRQLNDDTIGDVKKCLNDTIQQNEAAVNQLTLEKHGTDINAKTVIPINSVDLTPPEILVADEAFEDKAGAESPTSLLSPSDIIVSLEERKKETMGKSFEVIKKNTLKDFLKQVVYGIHGDIEGLLTMFMVAYEQLDTGAGRDVCHSVLEEPFFKPLWPYLLALYRFVHCCEEERIAFLMTKYMDSTPHMFSIKEQFCPSQEMTHPHDFPYAPAVAEIQRLGAMTCPLDKLECVVRMTRIICQCVDDYCEKSEPGIANVGADDLLPLVAYVAVKSGMPQLISETKAMEEFIHEGYLMGEEGYCLTSLQTALQYILNLPREPSDN